MAKKNGFYVYSTLACDVKYGPTTKGHNDIPVRDEHVLIKGGAGITSERLFTPRGVANHVTEYQMNLLKQDPVFNLHVENKHLVVDDEEFDADLVADSEMAKDPSAPKEKGDFKDVDDVLKQDGNELVIKTGSMSVPPPPKSGRK